MPDGQDLTLSGRKVRSRLMLVAVSVLLIAGCGGLPDPELPGPESPTPPLSKIDYVTRANEICRATTREIASRTERVGSPNLGTASGEERDELVEAIEPVGRLALSRLRNLTPPAEDAELIGSGLDDMEATLDAIGTDPTAPLDPVNLNRPDLFDYGLTGCFTRR
jgi:hypothetical protein